MYQLRPSIAALVTCYLALGTMTSTGLLFLDPPEASGPDVGCTDTIIRVADAPPSTPCRSGTSLRLQQDLEGTLYVICSCSRVEADDVMVPLPPVVIEPETPSDPVGPPQPDGTYL